MLILRRRISYDNDMNSLVSGNLMKLVFKGETSPLGAAA